MLVNDNFALFITINPNPAEYNDIPIHLKTCFRSIAFVDPDFERIATVTLLSDGFYQAQVSCFYFDNSVLQK